MRRRNRRGASALELALSLPVLTTFISVILDYGWYLSRLNYVQQAVHDGVRAGVTVSESSSSESAITVAKDHAVSVLEGMGIECNGDEDCTVEASQGTAGSLNTLTVTATLIFDPLAGLIPYPDSMNVSYTMAMEDQG